MNTIANLKQTGSKGQDLAEYGLLLGLIALAVFAAMEIFGQALLTYWNTILNGLPF